MLIKLSAIVTDAETQVRAAIHEDVVTDYAEQMLGGAQFPPIVLFHDGNQYYLGDGFHRTLAAQRNGLTEIPADVRKGTQADALWFALGANRENGLRLTPTDKRHAVEMALKTWGGEGGKSHPAIAAQIGCSESYVRRIDDEVRTSANLPTRRRVTGKDGKSYPASRPSKPSSRPAPVPDDVDDPPSAAVIPMPRHEDSPVRATTRIASVRSPARAGRPHTSRAPRTSGPSRKRVKRAARARRPGRRPGGFSGSSRKSKGSR